MAIDLSEIRIEIEKVKQKLRNQDESMSDIFRLLNQLLEIEELSKSVKPIGFEIGS